MSRKKDKRARANGDRDGNGKARRRKNGTGTLERRGDRWLARYYIHIDGERKRKTKLLSAQTVEEARAELAELSAGGAVFTRERELQRVHDELAGIDTAARAQAEEKAKADAERKAQERDAKAIAIADAFPFYEQSKKRPDSGDTTLAGYRGQYAIFAEWVRTYRPQCVKMRDFTPEMAEAFIDHIEKARSRNTRNKYLIFLRTFWRVLRWHPDSQLTIDPWDGIRTLTQAPDEVAHKELTADELARIGAVIGSEDMREALSVTLKPSDGRKAAKVIDLRRELAKLLAIGIYTGLRLGDCATLDWGCVDMVRGIIDTEPRKTARKYKRRVIIPIHPTLGAILAATPAEARAGYVLPTLAEIYLEHEPSMITNRVQAILTAAGIKTTTKAVNGEKARTLAGFHSLRHTFASIMLNAGVQYAYVEKMLAHSKESMTGHYFHENAASLAEAIATLPAVSALADGAGAAQEALDALPAPTQANTLTDGESAAESRFRAFCEAWDALATEDERERAKDYMQQH
ncbi:MAG: site-specific integrase [Kiritimatiellae bacterium]|nr:site-specific integrase [Kiritimatiellia bacterium]